MKKILVGISLVAFVLSAFATSVVTAYNNGKTNGQIAATPADVTIYDLHTKGTRTEKDSLLTTDVNIYGPYALTSADGYPMFKSMVIKGDIVTGTTPVSSFDYQIIPGVRLSDTTSAWTAACTLGTAAVNKQVDISTSAGKSIVFRVNNYDGTETDIPGYLGVGFRESVIYNRNK